MTNEMKIDLDRVYIPTLGIKSRDESIGNNGWINFSGETEEEKLNMKIKLQKLREAYENEDITLKLFLNDENKYVDFSVEEYKKKSERPQLLWEERNEREIITVPQLIKRARQEGYITKKIAFEVLHEDIENGIKRVRCELVTIKDGIECQIFASASVVRDKLFKRQQEYWQEMVETRALGRCFRYLLGEGVVEEEMNNHIEMNENE